jgi:hypothetical protein
VETGIAIAPSNLAFIDAVETRLATRLGGGFCRRVTHTGIVIELPAANPRPQRWPDISAEACVAVGRSQACVPTRAARRFYEGSRWVSSCSTGSVQAHRDERGRALRAETAAQTTRSSRTRRARAATAADAPGRRKFSRSRSRRNWLDYDDATRAASRRPGDSQWHWPVAIVCGGVRIFPLRARRRARSFAGEEATVVADVGVAGLWRLTERLTDSPPSRGNRRRGHGGRAFSVLAGPSPAR